MYRQQLTFSLFPLSLCCSSPLFRLIDADIRSIISPFFLPFCMFAILCSDGIGGTRGVFCFKEKRKEERQMKIGRQRGWEEKEEMVNRKTNVWPPYWDKQSPHTLSTGLHSQVKKGKGLYNVFDWMCVYQGWLISLNLMFSCTVLQQCDQLKHIREAMSEQRAGKKGFPLTSLSPFFSLSVWFAEFVQLHFKIWVVKLTLYSILVMLSHIGVYNAWALLNSACSPNKDEG